MENNQPTIEDFKKLVELTTEANNLQKENNTLIAKSHNKKITFVFIIGFLWICLSISVALVQAGFNSKILMITLAISLIMFIFCLADSVFTIKIDNKCHEK